MLYSWDELVNDYGIDVEKDYMNENGYLTVTSLFEIPGVRFSYSDEEMSTLNDDLSRGTKLIVDNSVTKIGNGAFAGSSTLKEIVLPDGVTSIENWAFAYTGLTSINIPNSVTSIGEWAFAGCTGLTSINIHDGVTTINNWTFRGCTGLSSINIPNSVRSIFNTAFENCTNLTKIYYSGTASGRPWGATNATVISE